MESDTQTQSEKYLGMTRNPDFEKRVSEAAEQALMEMDRMVASEVKLRYITHIFAKTLDDIAGWLTEPKFLN
ncbi:MAG: hypothetical protein V3S29_02630 [bacterium]